MKRTFITLSLLCMMTLMYGQKQESKRYELVNNMPLFCEQMKAKLTFPYAWQNNRTMKFDTWRKRGIAKAEECMSPAQPRAKAYDMKIIETEQREGYKAEKIEFNLSAWSRVPAYLLVPDGKGPFPAIVMYHDHGAHFSIGKEKCIRPFNVPDSVKTDADKWVQTCMDGVYVGDYYARHGYAVLAVDALFWNERGRKEGVKYDGQQALSSNFLQMGMSWGAFIVWDDIYTAEFMASLPFINKEKIGAVGFSMGAYRAWMVSALCPQIKAAAAICWMNDTQHLMTMTNNQNKGGSAYSMLIPNLRNYLDYAHVASLACPKPMLFFNGAQDKLFPVEGVENCYRTMHEVWKSQKVDNRLTTKIFDCGHHFGIPMQEETLTFFDRWLK